MFDQQSLKTLWELYKVFCGEGARNAALKTDSVSSFLGWLEYRDELGSGRYNQGVVDGHKIGLANGLAAIVSEGTN